MSILSFLVSKTFDISQMELIVGLSDEVWRRTRKGEQRRGVALQDKLISGDTKIDAPPTPAAPDPTHP